MKKTVLAMLALAFSVNASAQDYTQFINGDNIIGSITAPVTIIEYASMTCGHCANFDKNVVQPLKDDYIAKGKVAYAFRDFPLDRLAFAVSKVQRCVPKEDFYTLVEAYFTYQREWLGAEDKLAAIKNIAKLGGLSDEKVEECIKDENIQQEIEIQRQSAVSLGVNSTPTIFVNGKMHTGIGSYEELKRIIDTELK